MPSTIVIGYDGTDGARAALAEAARWAADLGSGLHLVFSFATSRLGGEMRDLDEAIRERGSEVIAEGVTLVPDGIPVTSEVRAQDPAEGLIAAAQEQGARCIVVGSYGERPLKSALVGSTPSRLLHLSETPVLVVRAGE